MNTEIRRNRDFVLYPDSRFGRAYPYMLLLLAVCLERGQAVAAEHAHAHANGHRARHPVAEAAMRPISPGENGVAPMTVSTPRVEGATATERAGGLILNGIAYTNDGSSALAIITSSEGVQRCYRSGDSIRQDVVVVAIHEDAVLISNRGKQEYLSLHHSQATLPTPAVTTEAPRPPTVASNMTLQQQAQQSSTANLLRRAKEVEDFRALNSSSRVLP